MRRKTGWGMDKQIISGWLVLSVLGLAHCTKAPNGVENKISKAQELLEKNQINDAIATLEDSLKIKPNEEAYIRLGVAYSKKNTLDEAARAYQRAIEINPNTPAAHSGLGSIYFRQGLLDKSIR